MSISEANRNWPNRHTVCTALFIAGNTACQIYNSSSKTTMSLNIPYRLFNLVQAISQRNRNKIVVNSLGLGALLCPHARVVSIGLDILFEAVNFYKKFQKTDQIIPEESSQALVCIEQPRVQYIPKQKVDWPNRQTVSTSLLVIANVVCEVLGEASWVTVSLNIPLRLLSLVQAASSGKHYKVALDILGLKLLLCPHGGLISIAFDLFSEAINFYEKPRESRYSKICNTFGISENWLEGVDPTNFSDAYVILNVPKERAQDLEFIKERHKGVIEYFTKMQSGRNAFWTQQFQSAIDGTEIAFQTLLKHIEAPHSEPSNSKEL